MTYSRLGDVPLINQGGGAYNLPDLNPNTFTTPDAPGGGTTVTYGKPSASSGLPSWTWIAVAAVIGFMFIGGAGRRRSLF